MSDLVSRADAIDAINVSWGLFDARKRVEAIPSEDRTTWWVPVIERLPEDEKIVLVTDDEGFVRMMSHEYIPDGGYWFTAEERIMVGESEIVAWMPLPEPYKGGAVEKVRSERK